MGTADAIADCSDAIAFFEGGKEETKVHSQVLRMASPVFNAMFASNMKEAQTRRILIDQASKLEFEDFYRRLLPGAQFASGIKPENVGSLLALSEYYQVTFLKDACVKALDAFPATVPILILAKKYGLDNLYQQVLGNIMRSAREHDFTPLKAHADILYDMVEAKRSAPAISELRPYLDKMHTWLGKRTLPENYEGVNGMEMYDRLDKLRRLL
eukprot:TRINITY_DN69667_c0_g1_i1.p1 TRINITY_DN69667_c0_g1~~TRINITY_DN69667_c0_g1_i1.p1  ORF type:complete len:233 (+),score=22.77 TRINITY_DN69667_c0_g1_i1:61-699(+)